MLFGLAKRSLLFTGLPLLPAACTAFAMSSGAAARAGAGGALNVLGTPLEACSLPSGPTTGWQRDGFCNTDRFDRGSHCVCSEVTQAFLEYTAAQGNDLSTPRGQFPGLKPGDRWCLCSSRWLEAQRVGKAPPVFLRSTHEKALNIIPLEVLMEHKSNLEASVEAEPPSRSEL